MVFCLPFLWRQDVTAGDGSEYDDSGIDAVTAAETEHQSRRYKTMSASFSLGSAGGRSAFAGSDSGSSSAGGGGSGSGGGGSGSGGGGGGAQQGVYENFRQELEMSSCRTEEEAGSAISGDEHSVASSAYQSDPLLTVAQGTVRKAGRLAVKNFLVHKKNKKVESATRRKWKSYWVCLKGGDMTML